MLVNYEKGCHLAHNDLKDMYIRFIVHNIRFSMKVKEVRFSWVFGQKCLKVINFKV